MTFDDESHSGNEKNTGIAIMDGDNQTTSTSTNTSPTATATISGATNKASLSTSTTTSSNTTSTRMNTIHHSHHASKDVHHSKLGLCRANNEDDNEKKTLEDQEKRERRLAQNRKTAKLRRDSDRLYLQQLQARKNVLAYENDCLKQEREALRKHHAILSSIIKENKLKKDKQSSSSRPPTLLGPQMGQQQEASLRHFDSLQVQQSLNQLANNASLLAMSSTMHSLAQQYQGSSHGQYQHEVPPSRGDELNTLQMMIGDVISQAGRISETIGRTNQGNSASSSSLALSQQQNQLNASQQFPYTSLLNQGLGQASLFQTQRLPYTAALTQQNIPNGPRPNDAAAQQLQHLESFLRSSSNLTRSEPTNDSKESDLDYKRAEQS